MTDPRTAHWHAACALAGRLAERGITRITLHTGSLSRELTTRTTDLPRELAQAPIGSIIQWAGGRMVHEAAGWRDATDTDAHDG